MRKTHVEGVGGIFIKARDPAKLYAWYARHLGMAGRPGAGVQFKWRDSRKPAKKGLTVWALFPKSSKYLGPSRNQFMLNYRVADLDGLLQVLAAQKVRIDKHRAKSKYGKFAWITDPEGNRIELWQPPR
ncbi:MAG: VOC family protein [Candidatus Eremiobacteraeota bacterium]|nr:VOC family protein [Candidatus Eremiobacteraeota bacterium]